MKKAMVNHFIKIRFSRKILAVLLQISTNFKIQYAMHFLSNTGKTDGYLVNKSALIEKILQDFYNYLMRDKNQIYSLYRKVSVLKISALHFCDKK